MLAVLDSARQERHMVEHGPIWQPSRWLTWACHQGVSKNGNDRQGANGLRNNFSWHLGSCVWMMCLKPDVCQSWWKGEKSVCKFNCYRVRKQMMLTLPLSMLMLLIRIVLFQRKQGQQSFSKPRNDNVQATNQGAKSRVSLEAYRNTKACNISRVFLLHFSSLIEIGPKSARSYKRKRKEFTNTQYVRLSKQGSQIDQPKR